MTSKLIGLSTRVLPDVGERASHREGPSGSVTSSDVPGYFLAPRQLQ